MTSSLRRCPPRPAALLLLVGLVGGCELPPPPDVGATEQRADATDGAAAATVPQTLQELRAQARPEAAEWQDEPRLVEVVAELDEGAVMAAQLTYVAAEAESLLTVALDGSAPSERRVSLSTLGLSPVSAAGLAEIPELPEGMTEPGDVAASAAPMLEECGVGSDPRQVRYTTGAPATWDGDEWQELPQWRAVVLGDGGGVVVDPVSGQADGGCFDTG